MLAWVVPLVTAVLSVPAAAQPCVPDVVRSVEALPKRGTQLRILSTEEYPKGSSFPPHHIQGLARLQGSRTVVFSGNSTQGAFLYAGRMGTQPELGPWRSNFKCKKRHCETPAEDSLVKILSLGKDLPHPGGIQATGNIVAFGVDQGADRPSELRFMDFTDPTAPRELEHLRVARAERRAETVGITKLVEGRYLLVAGARNESELTFYVSLSDDLEDPANRFIEAGTWHERGSGERHPDYQALQLVSQCDGRLYLLGTSGFVLSGLFDRIDVLRLELGPEGPKIRRELKKSVTCWTCLFRAGAGATIDPSTGELRYYGSAYWPERPGGGPAVLRFEEFAP